MAQQTLAAARTLTLSPAGLTAIKFNETGNHGPYLKPYSDPPGHSIGYGHYYPPGQNVPVEITEEQATALLLEDCQWAITEAQSYGNIPLTQEMFDALVDLDYNTGGVGILEDLWPSLTAKNYVAAGKVIETLRIESEINGKLQVNPGLVARRKLEAQPFLTFTS
jgi:GH24 family phage-related lysozyme (muramidase)